MRSYSSKNLSVNSNAYVGSAGEVTVNPDTLAVRVHNGSTPGGFQISSGGGAVATGTVTANFAKYKRGYHSTQSNVTVGTAIICNVLENSSGTDITVNTSTGNVTLASNKTYRLRGSPGLFVADAAPAAGYAQWYDPRLSVYIGTGTQIWSSQATSYDGGVSGPAEVIVTTTSSTVFQLRVTYLVNSTSIGWDAAYSIEQSPWIDIEEIGSTFTLSALDTMSTTGNVTVGGVLSSPQKTKASNDPGTVGQICWDSNYIYVCTATNTWKRSSLTGGY